MARLKARPIVLRGKLRTELKQLARAGTTPQRSALRAKIILLSAGGSGVAATARRLGTSDRMVRKWRARFLAAPQVESLYDRPRSGRPPMVPLAVRCELVKLACSRPDDGTAPFRDVWTYASLARSLQLATGLELSVSEIGRILRDEELRPHRVRYWLHSPDPDFAAKCRRICGLYVAPPAGATVLCIDEKTCLQALKRKRELRPAAPNRAGRLEFEYRRNGITTLLAAFEPRTGRVVAKCGPTRTAKDLLAFMDEVAAQFPGPVHVVWDNLNIHRGERWEEFNRRHGGRFTFAFTPLHASWMNQVEVWFGILQRRVIRYGSFRSVSELEARILGFIAHWNAFEAHPFRWTLRRIGRRKSRLIA